MIKAIIFIIVLVVSVMLGNQLQHDPGYVYISINHYTIETTLWFALLLLFLILGCITLIAVIMIKIIRSPARFKAWCRRLIAAKKQRLSYSKRMALEQQKQEATLLHLIEEKNTQTIDTFMAQLPRALRHCSNFLIPYSQYLIDSGQHEKAEATLRSELKRNFNDDYIHSYGTIFVNQTQLDFAESLLKKHPDSAQLMLTLGRLCIHHQLWGKAIHYLEQSIQCAPTQEAHVELGKLYERLNREDEACEIYKRGLTV